MSSLISHIGVLYEQCFLPVQCLMREAGGNWSLLSFAGVAAPRLLTCVPLACEVCWQVLVPTELGY